jgi:hypothetical protein
VRRAEALMEGVAVEPALAGVQLGFPSIGSHYL